MAEGLHGIAQSLWSFQSPRNEFPILPRHVIPRDANDDGGRTPKKIRVIWQSATLCHIKKASTSLTAGSYFSVSVFQWLEPSLSATWAEGKNSSEQYVSSPRFWNLQHLRVLPVRLSKDVFCERPLTWNGLEAQSRVLSFSFRKFNNVLQHVKLYNTLHNIFRDKILILIYSFHIVLHLYFYCNLFNYEHFLCS